MPGENREDYKTMEQMEGALAGISKDWTDQWEANARKEGRREGRREGWHEGWREGWSEGWRKGWREGLEEDRLRMNAAFRAILQDEVRDRFGKAVAAAFATSITTVEIQEKLIDLAMCIGTSESGDELLESVRSV